MAIDHRSLPIGVFDSGVGGLTVLKQLRKHLPNEDFVYIGDTVNNPYGTKSNMEIQSLSSDIMTYMEHIPVKLVVVACNTITVVANSLLETTFETPIVGNSRGLKTAINLTKNKRIAVMATNATIVTHAHKNEASAIDESLYIHEEPCSTLANLIEAGHINDSLIYETLCVHIENIIRANVDTIILGCTHYPLVKETIVNILEQKYPKQVVNLIDPGYETMVVAKEYIESLDIVNPKKSIGVVEVCFTKLLDVTQNIVDKALVDKLIVAKEISIKEEKSDGSNYNF